MREMKDSGVVSIGMIPVEWKTIKLKFLFGDGNEGLKIGPFGSAMKGKTLESGEYKIYNQAHLINNDFSLNRHFVSEETFQELRNYEVKPGDVLFSMMGTIGKCRIMPEGYPKGIMDSHLLKAGLNLNIVHSQYFVYAYDKDYSSQVIEQLLYSSNGTIMNGLNSTILKNVKIAMPYSLGMQRKIVNYLDTKCSKIDEIIEKQLSIIEKLKEYKISIITEVVTKGLDYEVDYKESGTEWLGKIPSHWQYLSFKNVLKERNEKNFPVKTAERLSLSIDKGVTLYSEKTTNLDRFKDDVSQYKLAHEGDFVLNSMNMIVGAVGISHYFGCVSPAYYTYYDNEEDHITAKYCDYLFHSKTVKKVLHSLGKGIMSIDRGNDRINTCRLKVSRTDLRALKIPVPPICEQREIVKYLQSKENLIDKTIADRNKAIEKLQEYKKSLIYEVVTGKKEV